MLLIDAGIWFCEIFGWHRILWAPPMLMLLVVLVAVEQIRGEP